MKQTSRIYHPSYRKLKAYSLTFSIVWQYWSLFLLGRIFGGAYYTRRLAVLHARSALRIKKAIMHLQGLFIKFGQLISILSNVLPEAFREPLAALQDKIVPRPYSEVQATFQQQIGKPIDLCFDSFDPTPIAAASIGQVHKAGLKGSIYVVKIQHADIDKIAGADLAILRNLVRIQAFFMNMKGSDYLYQQVREMIEMELDYTKEAEAMQRIGEILKKLPELNIKTPTVHHEYLTPKILVSGFCEGVNISQVGRLDEWGIGRRELATRLLRLYSHMILVEGYYHADPHPGNLLVDKNGVVTLLDYGAVAEVSPAMKAAIPELINALIKNDSEGTVKAMKKMGFIGPGKEAFKIAERHIELARQFLEDEVEMEGLNFGSVNVKSGVGGVLNLVSKVNIAEISKSIQVPKDYVLLHRTLLLLLGLCYHLDPTLNPLDEVKPFIQKNILKGSESITSTLMRTMRSQLVTAFTLPADLQKAIKRANQGELEFEIKSLKNGFKALYYLGHQFLFALLAIFSLVAMQYQWWPVLPPIVQWGAFVIFFILFFRAWYKGNKRVNERSDW